MATRLSKADLVNRIVDYAVAYGIDPAVAIAQLKRESANFKDEVVYGPFVGGAGEKGVSQFIPATWSRYGYGDHSNAYDPEYALTAWAAYMTDLLVKFNYDYSKALTGYNGGEGHVSDPGRLGPPSAAAQRYAREVLAAAQANPVAYPDGGAPPAPPPENKTPEWLPYALAGGVLILILLLPSKS